MALYLKKCTLVIAMCDERSFIAYFTPFNYHILAQHDRQEFWQTLVRVY